MTANGIVISGAGAWTSFGGLVHAAAAHRAGLSRARELPELGYCGDVDNESRPVTGHVAWGCDHFEGAARTAQLGTMALTDLLDSMERRPDPDRTAALVSLGGVPRSGTEGGDPVRDAQVTVRKVFDRCGLELGPRRVRCAVGGTLGFLPVLTAAVRAVQEGSFQSCIVGAIDSNCDPTRVQELFQAGRLRTADNPVGLIPGEAAAFLVVERADPGGQPPQSVLARVHPASWEHVPLSDEDAPDGRPLISVVSNALAAAGCAPSTLGDLLLDLNGEPRPSVAWGNALVHAPGRCDVTGWNVDLPIATFGDVGIAFGPLAAALACRAFVRDYARGTHAALVHCYDSGSCGAWCLEAPRSA